MREFAAKGFAGARVDAIAKRARINKRMLYHYFGDKQALFQAAVEERLCDRKRAMVDAPKDMEDILSFYFRQGGDDREWTRLMLWEALAYGEKPAIAEEQRVQNLRESVERMRTAQAEGRLDPVLDPEYTLLALIALCTFPWTMPQFVRFLTGDGPTSPRFREGYARVLSQIGMRIHPRNRASQKT